MTEPTPGQAQVRRGPWPGSAEPEVSLLLFVSGASSASARAIRNVQRMCEERLPGRYELSIIDVHQHRDLARDRRVLATPTLVKQRPAPERMLVGELSDFAHVLVGLGLDPGAPGRGPGLPSGTGDG